MKGGCNPADKTVMVYLSTSSKCQDDSQNLFLILLEVLHPLLSDIILALVLGSLKNI